MARLYRPHIPLLIRVQVATRQLRAHRNAGDRIAASVLAGDPPLSLKRRLAHLLNALAACRCCELSDLQLDHDPPLGARPQERRGLGRKTYYTPDANDPEHLFYRPHGPQFDGSHLIKTNVRGDNGQYPDRVLIKKAKRLERGPRDKPKRKWASRQMPKGRPFRKPKP